MIYQHSQEFQSLKKLVLDRLREGADVAAIDREIWSRYGGTYAVMFTDLAGFSRHVEAFGIVHFLQVIFESQRILSEVILRHEGEVIMTESDSMLIVFKQPESALRCAVDMQQLCADYNSNRLTEARILLCIGLGYGHCLKIGSDDIFGAEVNAASKLGEDMARAGEILMTDGFYTAIKTMPDVAVEILQEQPPGSASNALRLMYALRSTGQ